MFYLKEYICILALQIGTPGNQHCANCIGTLSFPISMMARVSDAMIAFSRLPNVDARDSGD